MKTSPVRAGFLAPHSEPADQFWRQPQAYDSWLEEEFLRPLQRAAEAGGRVPVALQLDVLRRLHWYFTVDARERAPTAVITPALAPAFLARIDKLMSFIEPETVLQLTDSAIPPEVRLVLYAWNAEPGCSAATVTACDHARQLVQVRYYLHGAAPTETWLVDDEVVRPAHEKFRACRYYYRNCLQQRIVWLPAGDGKKLQLRLDGQPHPVLLDSPVAGGWAKPVGAEQGLALEDAWAAFWRGRGGRKRPVAGLRARLKVGLMGALARLPWVRSRFRDAWVLVDRNENADDNAEHFYRWLKRHHPEVNAWFLLDSDAPDWERLSAEGFRLMPPGLMRKLLLLNSRHIISSHAEYVNGGFDAKAYGSLMGWKYTFLQHGVSQNDISSWLGRRKFDCFITSSPAEWTSIADSGSNYMQTSCEVHLTGMPRHDRLLELAASRPEAQPRQLLVMPTWRGGRFEERARGLSPEERLQLFATTEYVRGWRALLHDPALHSMLERHRWQLVFMPHVNTLPFIEAFDLPAGIEVVSLLEGGIQQRLIAASAFLTDYTSVAFDFALLRRPVFYYQFDRESFFGGGHNWRPGYFDYDRDGFGPVSFSAAEQVGALEQFFARGERVEARYLARMERAMPLVDRRACQRVYERIVALDQPGRVVDPIGRQGLVLNPAG